MSLRVASNNFGMLLSCGDVAATTAWFKKEELCNHRNVTVKKKEKEPLHDGLFAFIRLYTTSVLNAY